MDALGAYKDGIEQQQQQDATAIKDHNSYGSDLGRTLSTSKTYRKNSATVKVAVVHGLNRPLFHIDLTSALQSAIANIELRAENKSLKEVSTETT